MSIPLSLLKGGGKLIRLVCPMEERIMIGDFERGVYA